jgi:hypothetical protein
MAFLYVDVFADLIKETTITSGISDAFVLGGAQTPFLTFSSAMTNGQTCCYRCIEGNNWEAGIGTYNSSTNAITRKSTNANTAVNFTSATKEIYMTILADMVGKNATYKDRTTSTVYRLGVNNGSVEWIQST